MSIRPLVLKNLNKRKMKTLSLFILGIAFAFGSCTIIRPGEVGVKQKLGKLDTDVLDEGPHLYNPFVTTIITTPIRTQNIELALNLPSKEGLNVGAEISILFRIDKDMVPGLITTLGSNYYSVIKSVFRSASADICAQFMAKDMHSGKRAEIESEIAEKMTSNLQDRGIVIEAVLMKTIKLPEGLYTSIEDRMEAEQDALRMKYILEQERLEAERKIIEAEGSRDAQQILSEGLTKEILHLRAIEAFESLSQKEGTKVIISGSDMPFVIGDDK